MPSPERDLPLGHPSAVDYDPNSPEAREWKRTHDHPAGERDFPVDHPGAADNPNRVEPTHPQQTARDFSRPETLRRGDDVNGIDPDSPLHNRRWKDREGEHRNTD